MADLSLQEALAMFQNGVKEFGLTKALTEAQSSVQQIKMAGLKDAEQRKMLGDVAQGLVFRMQGLGASAQDIGQTTQAVMGPGINSAEQAILQGTLTGNPELTQAGVAAQKLGRSARLEELSAQEAIRTRADERRAMFQEESQGRLFGQQEKLLQERLAAQEKLAAQKQDNQKPSADAFKAAGFAQRASQAQQIFDDLKAKGYDAATVGSGLERKLPNILRSSMTQRQEQAERNFINAVLRRESGAAISDSEFESARIQYFPAAGDSAETLEQKRKNREQVVSNLMSEGSPALKKAAMSSGGEAAAAPQAPAAFNLRSFIKPKR